ncbi:putative metal-nicotianamine transporter YSL1 [Dichanthelium oligosanthes]|uniref:Putative metal-nicotianamine transporter YSL1 n=1 Tax=Dichanthelium oligosanthes TaxID=888268 RepID=A0A1E5VGI5_9POAL|nr:putative metal-nicotianamine transporter YSL1 [Dichanthelium oligosanthes]
MSTAAAQGGDKPALRKPVFTKVDQLRPGTNGHTLTVKVVGATPVPGRASSRAPRIAECLVGDETGAIVFTARNDQVDLLTPDATVILRNAKIDMFKGSMRLAVDKWGRIEAAEPASFTVKEDNNLSLVEPVKLRICVRRDTDMAGDVASKDKDHDDASVEALFSGQPPPPWWRQVTVRSVTASVVLGTVFSFISMRMGLTTGLVPSMNMSASLVSFFVISSWTRLLGRCGVATTPFNRQENVVVQTCVIACATLSFYGGFVTFLPAMSETVARSAGGAAAGNNVVYALHTGKMIAFSFLTGFSSLFMALPLTKVTDDHRNNPTIAAGCRFQVAALMKSLCGSFSWAAFQWFYTGGDGCGFQAFPLFGLHAYKKRFFFDFSPSLVGIGMICPYTVNFSLLLGAVLSSGILWPILQTKRGQWYADPSPSSLRGINGYKVPMGIALVLGDCLFQVTAVSIKAARSLYRQGQELAASGDDEPEPAASYDERRRTHNFQSDQMPISVALAGYALLAAIASFFLPIIFPQVRFYHVALCYAMAPLMAFCSSYATGLTDWSLGTIYGKLAIFIFGAWVGEASGGAVAGLLAGGIVVVVIGNSSELMHDFKSAYLTLTSPLSMFASQVIGTAIGCVINPLLFLGFQMMVGREHLGEAGSAYPAPMAMAYRGIADISIEGIKALPKHSIMLCIPCFVMALCLDGLAAVAMANSWRIKGHIPNIMAMTIPFFVGPTFTIDMFLGSLIVIIWRRADKQAANLLSVVMASGMICGDGFWALPSSLLAMFKVQPPICMKFLSTYQHDQMQQHFDPYLTNPQ